jgi:hypothetical protein
MLCKEEKHWSLAVRGTKYMGKHDYHHYVPGRAEGNGKEVIAQQEKMKPSSEDAGEDRILLQLCG